jgi:hypothetical protein
MKQLQTTTPKFNPHSGEPRLAEFAAWMKDRRRPTTSEDLDDTTFAARWWVWWKYLQPSSRTPLKPGQPLIRSLDIKFVGSSVDQAGPNGVALVLIALAWWWDIARDGNARAVGDWTLAANDVKWVLRHLAGQTHDANASAMAHKDDDDDSITDKDKAATQHELTKNDTSKASRADSGLKRRRGARRIPTSEEDEPPKKKVRSTLAANSQPSTSKSKTGLACFGPPSKSTRRRR